MTERDVIAATLWGEARGETTTGRLAVASVLQNRLRTGRWGHTYTEVCQAPWQFSCWNTTDPNHAKILRLFGSQNIVDARTSDPIVRECYWIADGLLQSAIQPQVDHATHYYATTMLKPPVWATGPKVRVVAIIGHHSFFENVQ